MVGEWPLKTIAECASAESYSTQIGPFGKALMADEYVEFGVPVLRGVNVNRGRFHDDDFVFIDNETADRLSKFESFPGEVLLVHKGTLGQIGLMPTKRKYPRYTMGNSMMRVRCNPTKLLPEYLYYWLTSADGQHYLFSRVSQVGVPQIQTPLTTLRQASLPVPPLHEQRAIAHILGTLDDKIELNRRMNEALEAMARTLFKSWFVDFDPVRAKIEGRDPALPKPLADLFPASFGDSELGEIPKGWEVLPLADITMVITKGTTPTQSQIDTASDERPHIQYVRVNAISGDGAILFDKLNIIPQSVHLGVLKRSILQGNDVLYTIAGTIGRSLIVEESLLPANTNQAVAVIRPKPTIPPEFLLMTIRQDGFREELHRNIVHAVQANLSLGMLSKARVVLPPENTLRALFMPIGDLVKRINFTRAESRTLAALRDTLLPKLISGELRLPENATKVQTHT